MKLHAFRLTPGQDLKQGIEDYANSKGIKAAFVVTCVGGLDKVTIRMAGAKPDKQDIRTIEEDLEIVSLTGTITDNGTHFHISVSDKSGSVQGGHLKEGSIINPTAEIVMGEDTDHSYTRKMDDATGFKELIIK